MTTRTIHIRHADERDAEGISLVHDAAWTEAYRGIIPGGELNRMIARRGPHWWQSGLKRSKRVLVLDFEGKIAGYATYGANRAPSFPYSGEIFELYLAPEYQGLGLGGRLFRAARRALNDAGLNGTLVWVLAENERGVSFYSQLGGALIGSTEERFGSERRERLAFGWV
ncbi:MAG: GNAT family N-acetyltransferase [Beijerinckiaceae bacterium]|nr:GNAT family N-acetyltransferase [Beijerinckiaceae bacterium]